MGLGGLTGTIGDQPKAMVATVAALRDHWVALDYHVPLVHCCSIGC